MVELAKLLNPELNRTSVALDAKKVLELEQMLAKVNYKIMLITSL